ncbi:MAG: SufD family Fe-S cluster assembly protein [Proteobacteria bacterium]|nr:FeS assembly protein SufBD [Desulfobulbaceae bacterium]MBU4151841.1 SufD family Fe-S cluster assembly protein [Pseudomonadota bacterium]MDP2106835.1 SufD family Fe-S cluster assembly protein [Desulfobulbaceae bacterium]
MSELDSLLQVFGEAGGDRGALGDTKTAHLAASGHAILSSRTVEGLEVEAMETSRGISARLRLRAGVRLENPVHLCFGVLHEEGTQEIVMDVTIEDDAKASFIAHCIFPKAKKVRHIMNAVVAIGENAEMRYAETHYHGLHGGIEVMPTLSALVGKNSRYCADFTLITGRVGKLDIDYDVTAAENAVVELTTRVFGHGNDELIIKERVVLAGENSRGLIKARVALEDQAKAEVRGITEGNAAGARGHVDCMEIVKDQAIARAVPIVQVNNPLAKVTHEAAIGSVDKRQMETLMAHGLSSQEAVDVIVKGILH